MARTDTIGCAAGRTSFVGRTTTENLFVGQFKGAKIGPNVSLVWITPQEIP
jgi:hypothetical protein